MRAGWAGHDYQEALVPQLTLLHLLTGRHQVPPEYRSTSLITPPPPPQDPAVAPCLGIHGEPKEAGVSYERGNLVQS